MSKGSNPPPPKGAVKPPPPPNPPPPRDIKGTSVADIARAVQRSRDAWPTAEEIAMAFRSSARAVICDHDWREERLTVEGYTIARCARCGWRVEKFPE